MIEHNYIRADMLDSFDTDRLGAELTDEESRIIGDIMGNVMERSGKVRADRDPNHYWDLIITYEDIPELEHMYFERWYKENDNA